MSITTLLPDKWDDIVQEWSNTTKAEQLREFVKTERSKFKVWPEQKNVFRAFRLTPPNKVKVIIIGQDPYHTPNVADGLAFSSGLPNYVPPSVRVIFEEVCAQFQHHVKEFKNADLSSWAEQGVLLINTALTVRQGSANSHKNKGWEILVENAISLLAKDSVRPKVYMLWGTEAKKYKRLILSQCKEHSQILILEAAHPAAELHKPTGPTFRHQNHFTKCNEFLKSRGVEPINWLSVMSA